MAPGNPLDRSRPVCNAAVENFVHARHFDAHRRKLTGARSLIDNTRKVRQELKLQASRHNVKREQMMADRYEDIEKENMRLLLRLQEIDRRREVSGNNVSGKAAAKILLDGAAPSRASSLPPPAAGRGSNSAVRLGELRRIDDENRRFLKRLQSAKPTVNNTKLAEQHREQQKLMRMRKEFQPQLPPRPPRGPDYEAAVAAALAAVDSDIGTREAVESYSVAAPATPLASAGAVPALSTPTASPSAAADVADDAADEQPPDSPVPETPVKAARRVYAGGKLPVTSHALAAALMEEHFGEDVAKLLEAPPVPEEDPESEEIAARAKEAAQQMLRAARSLDTAQAGFDGPELLGYDHVVQRGLPSHQPRLVAAGGGIGW